MYQFANLVLVASFIFSLSATCFLVWQTVTQPASRHEHRWPHVAHWMLTALITLTCIFLLYAFIACDFSLKYVQDYSSRSLAFFYRVTAFWAGQPGSLLFWAWTVALSGLVFPILPIYKQFSPTTRSWYWCCFFTIMAFFLLILITWNNPFELVERVREDGYGLNPLLQDPGMIFHPPLLFLGYGGFVVPGCLALAQAIKMATHNDCQEPRWALATRGFTLVGWAMLTAGIILGAWWAYMELGWGGYWAWDPVENASLIPWLAATAYLHTSVIEIHRDKLHRTSIFLMALTTISAFFATYLVRSGVIQSLHAFGAGGLGAPFLAFVLAFLVLTILVCFFLPSDAEAMDDLTSREGLLIIVAWILLALAVIILIATMWPVIVETAIGLKPYLPTALAAKLPNQGMGLEPAFYNRTCLPLFAALGLVLMFCPYKAWNKGFISKNILLTILAGAILLGLGLYVLRGLHNILSVVAIASSFAAFIGIIMLFAQNPALLKNNRSIIAHGTHLGLLLMLIGVAFSGPYQSKHELLLSKGQSTQIGRYAITLEEIFVGESAKSATGLPYYSFHEVALRVTKDGKHFGILSPQMRRYTDYEDRNYPAVATIFTLGDELYSTFTSLDREGRARVEVNVNPMVNWLWIGGVLMSVFPLAVLFRHKRKEAQRPPRP